MVRPRTNAGKDRDRDMAQAGARFETYVRAAMAEVELPTLAELYRASGIAASTWSGWFRGVSAPRRNSMVLAGPPLHRTPEQLLAAWDGETPHKPRRATQGGDPVAEAIRDQTAMLERVLTVIADRLPTPPDPLLVEAMAAQRQARTLADTDQPRSTSQPQKRGPSRRAGGGPRASREADPT